MKWLTTMLVVTFAALMMLAATSTRALAQAEPDEAPSTHPSASAVEETAEEEMPRDGVEDDGMRQYGRQWMGRWGGGPGGGGASFGEISEEEWLAAEAFMREHSPNRWRLFERLSDGSDAARRRRGPVVRMIIARYRNLQNVKEEDPALYDLRVQQLTVDDEIWRIVRDMRRSSANDEREKLRGALREKVSASIEVWMKEREHRLGRLEETLKRERERLATDQSRRESMVENRLQRELERVPDFMAFPRGGAQ